MFLAETFRDAWKRASAFLRNRSANVAMIFAISSIPVVIAAGAGLDLTRAMIVKSALSEALDAAALSVGSAPGLTQAQMQTQAQNYFNANYKVDAAYGTPAAVTVVPNGQSVTVSTSVPMPTTLMSVAGIHSVPVDASSTVVWGQTKLWVSLVLDNTGSMCESDANRNASSPCPHPSSGAKIVALKSATHSLLTMLQGASANPGDVQVALVPFVKDVNVGTGFSSASWIDWGYFGSCNISGITYQSKCQTTHGTWTTWNGNGTCSISGKTTQNSCQNATGTWTGNSHSNWNGCVNDRGNDGGPDTNNNYDVMKTSPSTGTVSSLFVAENYSSCPQALIGLGYNWSALSTEVDAMVADGTTNQSIGLVWGWHALSTGAPLNALALPANTARYIIILSDGLNTQNRWSSSQSSVDARMSLVCTNAKADHIIIYAVFVDIGGTQGNSTVLQNCATDATKYFDLTSTTQIADTFNNIGQQITNLRVAR